MSKEAMKLALEALEVATTPLARDRQEVLRAQAALREALAEQPAQQQQCMEHGECFGGECIYPATQPAQQQELRKQQFDHTAAANAALRDAQNRSYKIARTAQQQQQEPVAIDPKDVKIEVVLKQMGGFAPVMTNGIRLTHKPTGIVVEETAERSAHRNRDVAWKKLAKLVASSQPAQQQEPVAYVYEREIDGFGLRKDVKFLKPVEVGSDLYTSPPASKPLTDEQILSLVPGLQDCLCDPWDYNNSGDYYASIPKDMIRLARAIEAAHGIKGDA